MYVWVSVGRRYYDNDNEDVALLIDLFSAGTVFIRQNLTSVDVRF